MIENDTTAGNSDIARFGAGVATDRIWFRQVNQDLEASILGTADHFTFQNWYGGSQYRVEQFKVTDTGNLVLRPAKVNVRLIAKAPDVIFRAIPCIAISTLIMLLRI